MSSRAAQNSNSLEPWNDPSHGRTYSSTAARVHGGSPSTAVMLANVARKTYLVSGGQ